MAHAHSKNVGFFRDGHTRKSDNSPRIAVPQERGLSRLWRHNLPPAGGLNKRLLTTFPKTLDNINKVEYNKVVGLNNGENARAGGGKQNQSPSEQTKLSKKWRPGERHTASGSDSAQAQTVGKHERQSVLS